MKPNGLVIFFIFLLTIQSALTIYSQANVAGQEIAAPDVYIGLDVGYENLTATKQIADEISPYANFFIIGCSDVTYNLTQLNDLCQYLYDKDFYFMAYRITAPNNSTLEALRKWGDHFLGFYAYDELGGRQLDQAQDYITVSQANSYADASTKYVNTLNGWLRNGPFNFTRNFAYPTEFPLVTSDYALYWYDYRAGYDTIFAEFGWNYSRQINVALCRGAATAQNKNWGVMITHTYTTPPYLESGEELYQDMVYAYQNGAKYIVIFDSNPQWTQGTLKQEHLDAMKQFWQYTQNNPRTDNSTINKMAYVLPADYAYGFRGPTDKIWGLWEADDITDDLSMGVGYLLMVYGENLDIIYEDSLSSTGSNDYRAIIYWNDPRLFQPNYPNLSPAPTQDPISTPIITPSPSQTNSSASPSPTLTPSPSPSASPTPQPTSTSNSPKNSSIPLEYLVFITVGAFAAAIVVILRIKKKRRDKQRESYSFPVA